MTTSSLPLTREIASGTSVRPLLVFADALGISERDATGKGITGASGVTNVSATLLVRASAHTKCRVAADWLRSIALKTHAKSRRSVILATRLTAVVTVSDPKSMTSLMACLPSCALVQ
jgi:hypothetical protein